MSFVELGTGVLKQAKHRCLLQDLVDLLLNREYSVLEVGTQLLNAVVDVEGGLPWGGEKSWQALLGESCIVLQISLQSFRAG